MMKHAKGELKARPSPPPLTGRRLVCSLRSMVYPRQNVLFHINNERCRQGSLPAGLAYAEVIPLCRSSASGFGSRPRKALNDSIAGREPPTERISRQ